MQTSCLWLFRIGFFCNSIQTVPLDSAGTALYFVDNKENLNVPVCSAAKATHSKLTEEITSVETQTCCRHLVVFLSHFGFFFQRQSLSLLVLHLFVCLWILSCSRCSRRSHQAKCSHTAAVAWKQRECKNSRGQALVAEQRHAGLLRVCLKLPKNHIQAEKMTTRHSCSLKRFLYKFKCNFIITQMWLISESEQCLTEVNSKPSRMTEGVASLSCPPQKAAVKLKCL